MKTCRILTLLLGLFSICTNAQECYSKASRTSFLLFLKDAKQEKAAAITFSKPGESAASSEQIKNLIQRSKDNQDTPVEIVECKELGTVARRE